MNFTYAQLTSRNWLYINKTLQVKIRKTRIVFAGCGLGSNLAILAARLGFTKFSLWDGDKVEISNLNRQNYFIQDVGKNKAEVLSRYILSINPKAAVKVNAKYIDLENVSQVLEKGDILINTVNFNSIFFRLLELASMQKNITLLPLNIEFGSVVIVFQRMYSLIKKRKVHISNDLEMYNYFLKNLKDLKINRKIFNKKLFQKIRKVGFEPQLGIAASISAGLAMKCILLSIQNKKLKEFPYVYQLN